MFFTVEKAAVTNAEEISVITKRAFLIYRNELKSTSSVSALSESTETIVEDIKYNTVFVAKNDDGKIIGAIRCKALSDKLYYIYRFGVDPSITSTGVGSSLLERTIEFCEQSGAAAIALHTNSRYYKLARYYYGKNFFVHSTDTSRGYIRALFIKELTDNADYDISPAHKL